jgi:hypothetical protein
MNIRKFIWEVKHCRHVKLTISLSSVSWLSRKCGILDIKQPYKPPRPITGTALFIIIFVVLFGTVTFFTCWWGRCIGGQTSCAFSIDC